MLKKRLEDLDQLHMEGNPGNHKLRRHEASEDEFTARTQLSFIPKGYGT